MKAAQGEVAEKPQRGSSTARGPVRGPACCAAEFDVVHDPARRQRKKVSTPRTRRRSDLHRSCLLHGRARRSGLDGEYPDELLAAGPSIIYGAPRRATSCDAPPPLRSQASQPEQVQAAVVAASSRSSLAGRAAASPSFDHATGVDEEGFAAARGQDDAGQHSFARARRRRGVPERAVAREFDRLMVLSRGEADRLEATTSLRARRVPGLVEERELGPQPPAGAEGEQAGSPEGAASAADQARTTPTTTRRRCSTCSTASATRTPSSAGGWAICARGSRRWTRSTPKQNSSTARLSSR